MDMNPSYTWSDERTSHWAVIAAAFKLSNWKSQKGGFLEKCEARDAGDNATLDSFSNIFEAAILKIFQKNNNNSTLSNDNVKTMGQCSDEPTESPPLAQHQSADTHSQRLARHLAVKEPDISIRSW